MPELAEVEFNRKQWNCGVGRKILKVGLHAHARNFRSMEVNALLKSLPGARLTGSEAHGKQLLFRFSGHIWLGVHLGMTGQLRVASTRFQPGRHDHLVLWQTAEVLVFTDPRQFGRVRFHQGLSAPDWWTNLPVAIHSRHFTLAMMESFLERHRRLPIKAALLLQSGFPGIGNWMADEVLWRAGLHPRLPAGKVKKVRASRLWQKLRFVCRESMRRVGADYSELPEAWLFHQRWSNQGQCPRHGIPLYRETIGGRTTAWCPKCQPG